MTPERYARLNALLDAVSGLPAADCATFLAGACADDPSLAREVERHRALAEDDAFLADSALDQAARDLAAPAPDARVGRTFSHYEIVEHLGGGMSDVYRARDHKMGRDVVVKLLPAGLADGDAVARLTREARTLSSLNHPHVVTIHDVDEADGRVFLAMEYVAGKTLRAVMAGGPVRVAEAVAIARQIALALEASHAAGVLHRDVKPDNVMVRSDGFVKVLDFGIAKLVHGMSDAAGDSRATAAGRTLGTPGYMSPEQIRGAGVDARSDVFALGVVLYEMLSGRPPFAGDTPADGLAATLTLEPPTLGPLNPEVPGPLQQVVMTALRKRASERFASVREFRAALDDAMQHDTSATAPPARGVAGRRGRRLVAAVVALVAVAAAAALFTAMGGIGRARLTARDTILLGPFENGTGDAVFDQSLRRALTAQLEQSPFLALFGEERVRRSLQLMKQPADQMLTVALAREVCLRNGLKAFVTGAIDSLGGRYLITLEAFEAESGSVIGRSQVEAASRDGVLAALRLAAASLRVRLGETLASIQRFDPPVDQVTTSSLEALESYARGRDAARLRRPDDAIALLVRATALDPDFAVAYAQLSAAYANAGNDPRAAEAASRAYALRDGVSERERLYITQHYHRFVDGDLDRSIQSLLLAKELYPRDSATRINLASLYLLIGRPDDALAESSEALRLNPDNITAYTNAATALVALGRLPEARRTLAVSAERGHSPNALADVGNAVAFIEGDVGPTFAEAASVAGTPLEAGALNAEAAAAAVLGQWRRSALASQRAVDRARRVDRNLAARFAFEASIRAAAFGRCDEARQLARDTEAMTSQAWFLSGAAVALALCGEATDAKRLVERLTADRPRDVLVNLVAVPAVRALGETPEAALRTLQHLEPYESGLYAGSWPAYLRGLAHLRHGAPTEAAREFGTLTNRRSQLLSGTFTPPWSLVELSRARAQVASGDPAAASDTYTRLLAFWRDADPDLPELAQARAELERLR